MSETHLIRSFPAKPFVATSARGAALTTADGQTFWDFGGASHGVALLGHNHPRVVAAIRMQADQLLHVAHGVPTSARAVFLDTLHAHLSPELDMTFIGNSGTEAVEAALKLAAVATKRHNFVAATDSFHGRSLGALGMTHRPAFREPFAKLVPACSFAPFGDLEEFKRLVNRETAAIVIEPVQGEGGVRVSPRGFLKALADIAHDAGALLVCDEVQSGMGRTGTFLASTADGVVPDIVTLAKGLAGGIPIGTASCSAAVAAALPPGGHGTTYGGNPLACAAGAAALQVLDEERLLERAQVQGERWKTTLQAVDHPAVRSVEGRGLMMGLSLRTRAQTMQTQLNQAGFLVLGGGPNGVRMLPPLNIEPELLDRFTTALAATATVTA